MASIGFIGAGNIGGQVARLSIAAGHEVVLSNSRGPDTLASLVAELGPKARAATVEETAKAGEIVVVTIPLENIGLPSAPERRRAARRPRRGEVLSRYVTRARGETP